MTKEQKEFNQLDYIKQFNKENYKHYHIKVNLKDKEVIDKLDGVGSKNGYIIDLIKKDIGGDEMKNIKEQALNDLRNKLFNSDIEGWRDEDTDTLYRWYQGNELSSNIGQYVNLVEYEEFKYQVDSLIKELKEELID